jgi:hypothetical protein
MSVKERTKEGRIVKEGLRRRKDWEGRNEGRIVKAGL